MQKILHHNTMLFEGINCMYSDGFFPLFSIFRVGIRHVHPLMSAADSGFDGHPSQWELLSITLPALEVALNYGLKSSRDLESGWCRDPVPL